MASPKRLKKFSCSEADCYAGNFSRRYELERHKKSKHNYAPLVGDQRFYRCADSSCQNKQIWARADHLRQHAKRLHPGVDLQEYVRSSILEPADLNHENEHQTAPVVARTPRNAVAIDFDKAAQSALSKFSRLSFSARLDPCSETSQYVPDAGCGWQDTDIVQRSAGTDSAIGFPRPLHYDHRQDSVLSLSGNATSQAAPRVCSALEDEEYNYGQASVVGLPGISLVHPSPVRPSTLMPVLLQRGGEPCDNFDATVIGDSVLDHSTNGLNASRRPASAPPKLSLLPFTWLSSDAAVLCAQKPIVRTCAEGQGRGSGGATAYKSTAPDTRKRQQPEPQRPNKRQREDPGDFPNKGTGAEPPGSRKIFGRDSFEFPCVYHHWPNGEGNCTVHCATFQEFVSKLAKHHSAQGHPDGPFIYCTHCFRHNFEDEAAKSAHKTHGCEFVCVTEGCDNYDRQPVPGVPCGHGPGNNSQYYIWRKLYRIAHKLGPNDPVPDTRQRLAGLTSMSTFAPALAHVPQPPTFTSDHLDVPPLPPRPRSLPPLALRTPQFQYGSYSGMRGLTPAVSRSTAPLPPTDEQAYRDGMLSTVQNSLDRLARTMWQRVNCPQPGWSTLTLDWYDTALAQSEHIGQLGDPIILGQISLLRTLLRGYRALIDGDESDRTPEAWTEVSQLTDATLRIPTPDRSPWSHHQPLGQGTVDAQDGSTTSLSQAYNPNMSVPTFNPTVAWHADLLDLGQGGIDAQNGFTTSPTQSPTTNLTVPSIDTTGLWNAHLPENLIAQDPGYMMINPHTTYDFEADASASTTWERIKMASNGEATLAPPQHSSSQFSSATSENAESAYVSWPESGQHYTGKGKARSEGSAISPGNPHWRLQ